MFEFPTQDSSHRPRRRGRDIGNGFTLARSVQLLTRFLSPREVEVIQDQASLKVLNGFGGIDTLGAYARAFTCVVTAKCPCRPARYLIAPSLSLITRVLVIPLCRRQRHRTQIPCVRGQSRACSHAARALDAVCELEVRLKLFGRLIEFTFRVVDLRLIRTYDERHYRPVLFKQGHEIRNQVTDDIEIRQGSNAEMRRGNMKNLGVTRQTRLSIQKHSAGATNPHTTRRTPC